MYGIFLGCKSACVLNSYAKNLMQSVEEDCIVNVASAGGLVGIQCVGSCVRVPCLFCIKNKPRSHTDREAAAYCASKAAVLNLTKSVALGYAQYRIPRNAVCPGCKIAVSYSSKALLKD